MRKHSGGYRGRESCVYGGRERWEYRRVECCGYIRTENMPTAMND